MAVDAPITELMYKARSGDRAAEDELIRAIEQEIRRIITCKLKGEGPGHNLDVTTLMDDVCIKLLGQKRATIQDRAHLLNIAAVLIRRQVIERARQRQRRNRHAKHVTLDTGIFARSTAPLDLLLLDESLAALECRDEVAAKVVINRFFGGMTIAETAVALSVSESSVEKKWAFARAWLQARLTAESPSAS